jgi:nucleoside-diphosphate kinase
MSKQNTVALVKCGAVERGHTNAILARIAGAGLSVVSRRDLSFDAALCEAFYAEHVGRPYYDGLAASVSAPCGVVALLLEGDDAILRWRGLLGPTDPTKAPEGSIRADFGTQMPDNAGHGSDSAESAAREAALLFPHE